MTEYIYEIEEDQSDESEVFIGWIRRHSKQLIRCKDCKWHREDECYAWDDGTVAVVSETPDDGFCSWAERKEE